MIVHTIPVPHFMSVEQAWEMIRRGDKLKDLNPRWANIETDDDGHFIRLIKVEDE